MLRVIFYYNNQTDRDVWGLGKGVVMSILRQAGQSWFNRYRVRDIKIVEVEFKLI